MKAYILKNPGDGIKAWEQVTLADQKPMDVGQCSSAFAIDNAYPAWLFFASSTQCNRNQSTKF